MCMTPLLKELHCIIPYRPTVAGLDRRGGGGSLFLQEFKHTTVGTHMFQRGPGACSPRKF